MIEWKDIKDAPFDRRILVKFRTHQDKVDIQVALKCKDTVGNSITIVGSLFEWDLVVEYIGWADIDDPDVEVKY